MNSQIGRRLEKLETGRQPPGQGVLVIHLRQDETHAQAHERQISEIPTDRRVIYIQWVGR